MGGSRVSSRCLGVAWTRCEPPRRTPRKFTPSSHRRRGRWHYAHGPMRSPMWPQVRRCVGLAVALSSMACGGQSQTPSAPSVVGTTPVPSNPVVSARYVTVGFWQDATCAGAPGNTTAFPVDYGDGMCFVWPGRSGENSASRFECGADSFSYTQWTTLTCSGGQVPAGTRKTVTTGGCTQGVPPTQYARIVDFSGCQMAR